RNLPITNIWCTDPKRSGVRQCNRSPRVGHPAMNLAALQCILKRLLIHTEIVAGGGLDIAMSGEFLDEHDVGSVVKQAGTERMAQKMRGQLLGDATPQAKPPEQLRHV